MNEVFESKILLKENSKMLITVLDLIEIFYSTIYQSYTLNVCYVIKAWLILVSCTDRKT